MTISIKPTASGSTIEQDGGTILSVDGSGNLSTPNNLTVTGTISGNGSGITGVSSYSDSDALSLFNAGGSAPVYACRAWVSFQGTGTVTIRSSGNVSSVTDGGTGKYLINFSSAMPDTNYSIGHGSGQQTAGNYPITADATTCGVMSASQCNLTTQNVSGAETDKDQCFVQVFR